jgi:hypothetical protein
MGNALSTWEEKVVMESKSKIDWTDVLIRFAFLNFSISLVAFGWLLCSKSASGCLAQEAELRQQLMAERDKARAFEFEATKRLQAMEKDLETFQSDSQKCEALCGIRAELELLRKAPCSK